MPWCISCLQQFLTVYLSAKGFPLPNPTRVPRTSRRLGLVWVDYFSRQLLHFDNTLQGLWFYCEHPVDISHSVSIVAYYALLYVLLSNQQIHTPSTYFYVTWSSFTERLDDCNRFTLTDLQMKSVANTSRSYFIPWSILMIDYILIYKDLSLVLIPIRYWGIFSGQLN